MIDQQGDVVYNGLNNHRLYFIDTETTGLIKKEKMPQIVQIAILDGESEDYYSSFVNPGDGKFIEPEAQKVNKISQSDIENAPKFSEVYQEIKDFIKKKSKIPILVAYNGKKFDFPLILHHMNEYKIKIEDDWKFSDFYLHVKQQVKPGYFEQMQGSKSQASLYKYLFNCQIPNHHQALGDVQALKQICLKAQHYNNQIKSINQLQLHIFDQKDIQEALDNIIYDRNNYQIQNNHEEQLNQQFKKLSIQSASFNSNSFSYKKEELKLQKKIQKQ